LENPAASNDVWLSTEDADAGMTFSGFGAEIRAVGGRFFATDLDGSPLLLMSTLSAHTRHVAAQPRVSILLSQRGKGDPLAHPRLTVVGDLAPVEAGRDRVKARFLARHPKAALYADFGDFAFYRLTLKRAHLNGGFARAAQFAGADLVTDLAGADGFEALENSAVEHMNADHADALRLYAEKLCGEPEGRWRATGLDPEGLDLACGDLTARLAFPARVVDGESLRRALVELASAARAK
jgi:putative heme iron utilization protein